jgi:hypothetical protein
MHNSKRLVVHKNEASSDSAEIPSFAGESQTAASFRREAYRQCSDILREAFNLSVASLTREVVDMAAVYLTTATHGEEARVAVIAAGFCDRSRHLAANAITEALQRRSAVSIEVNIMQPATFEKVAAETKNAGPSNRLAIPSMVLIVGYGDKSDVGVAREVPPYSELNAHFEFKIYFLIYYLLPRCSRGCCAPILAQSFSRPPCGSYPWGCPRACVCEHFTYPR